MRSAAACASGSRAASRARPRRGGGRARRAARRPRRPHVSSRRSAAPPLRASRSARRRSRPRVRAAATARVTAVRAVRRVPRRGPASSSAAGSHRAPRSPPMRHGPRPRSGRPPGVTSDEVGVREHEIERGAPAVDQHGAREQPGEHRLQTRDAARGTQLDQRHGSPGGTSVALHAVARPRRPRAAARARVAVLEPLDRRRGGVAAPTTTARIASPSAAATAASAPGSISRWSTSGPIDARRRRRAPRRRPRPARAPSAGRAPRRALASRAASASAARHALGSATPAGSPRPRPPPSSAARRLARRRGVSSSPASCSSSCRARPAGAPPRRRRASRRRLRRPRRRARARARGASRRPARRAPGPLAQRLDPHQRFGELVVARRGERVLGARSPRRRARAAVPDLGLASRELGALVAQPLDAGSAARRSRGPARCRRMARSSATTPPWRRAASAWRCERGELAAHLAQQVVEPQEVALGGLEPPLGLLPALAVLQDRRPPPR